MNDDYERFQIVRYGIDGKPLNPPPSRWRWIAAVVYVFVALLLLPIILDELEAGH